jgi:hypothetical protein
MMHVCALVLLAVAALSFLAAPPAEAVDPIKNALAAGGNRLKNLQNGDGGWFFDVGDTDCGSNVWPGGVSCKNTYGVTAMGLLEAFRVTKNAQLKAAALETGDALVDAHATSPGCDGVPGTGGDRPFTTDVTFLAELTKTTTKAVYKNAAKAWFACVTLDFPSAADRADNRIDGRHAQGLTNLGAWDAANDIRAAVALGQRPYAVAEMKRVIQRRTFWDVDDPDCSGCEILSKGWLLGAGATLKTDGTIKTWLNAWRDDLLDAQEADGSWNDGDTQTTAYVVIGLAANPTGPNAAATAAITDAIADGVAFLIARQVAQGNGGFEVVDGGGFPENTEVDSEALQALKAAK